MMVFVIPRPTLRMGVELTCEGSIVTPCATISRPVHNNVNSCCTSALAGAVMECSNSLRETHIAPLGSVYEALAAGSCISKPCLNTVCRVAIATLHIRHATHSQCYLSVVQEVAVCMLSGEGKPHA